MVTTERREGIVHSVHPGEVVVYIRQQSACSSCHAKEFCCSTDCAERELRIKTDSRLYTPGDAVIVEGANNIGRLAILLAFILPTFLFISSLGISINIACLGESFSILIALAILALYYGLLYLLDPKLGTIMTFEITKAE